MNNIEKAEIEGHSGATEQSPIIRCISNIERQLDVVHDRLLNLGSRLEQVRSPQIKPDIEPRDEPGGASPLENRLMDILEGLEVAESRLQEIIQELRI